MCILFVYTCSLLKGVSYNDLSVQSMSMMGFQKKFGCEHYPSIFWIFGIVLTLQSP